MRSLAGRIVDCLGYRKNIGAAIAVEYAKRHDHRARCNSGNQARDHCAVAVGNSRARDQTGLRAAIEETQVALRHKRGCRRIDRLVRPEETRGRRIQEVRQGSIEKDVR